MNFTLKMGVVETGRQLPSATPGPTDPTSSNYFQVRVLPDMIGIKEKEYLPWYPNFFSDKDIAYQPGDLVWTITEEDFKVGYIVGYAQTPAGDDISSFIQLLNTAEAAAQISQSGINDVTIDHISNKYIRFTTNTGRNCIVYNSKIIYIFEETGTIYTTNGSHYSMIIAQSGDITITGATKKENYEKNVDIKGGDNTEDFTSKKISTTNNMSINNGGSYQLTTGGNINHNAIGSTTNVSGSTISNIAGAGITNTVALGGINNIVGAGAYTITVAGGVVNITSLAVNIEALTINLIGFVSIVGALNLVAAHLVQLPISTIGFAVVGGIGVAVPTCIGI